MRNRLDPNATDRVLTREQLMPYMRRKKALLKGFMFWINARSVSEAEAQKLQIPIAELRRQLAALYKTLPEIFTTEDKAYWLSHKDDHAEDI